MRDTGFLAERLGELTRRVEKLEALVEALNLQLNPPPPPPCAEHTWGSNPWESCTVCKTPRPQRGDALSPSTVRGFGGCGEPSPDGTETCLDDRAHLGPHEWQEGHPKKKWLDQIKERAKNDPKLKEALESLARDNAERAKTQPRRSLWDPLPPNRRKGDR